MVATVMRQIKRILILILVIFTAFIGQDAPPKVERWRAVSQPYQFNFLQWEVENLPNKWRYSISTLGGDNDLPRDEELEEVRNYFTREEELAGFQRQIELSRDRAGNDSAAQKGDAEEKAGRLRAEQDKARNLVEYILEEQTSAVLKEQGLVVSLPLFGTELVFPPVDFEFSRLPKVLIISPRNRIELTDTVTLTPEIDHETREDIEDKSESFGVSALVENIGGIATYPSMVPSNLSLRASLDTIAHEWLHAYLFFYPLGRRYFDNYRMTQINETVVDIGSREIGCLIYQIYDGAAEDCSADYLENEAPKGVTGFNFNREMRETRLTVDRLLEVGQIEEAEEFMEQKRRYLQDNGYYIRKLNQAYFAFHGTYADQPTSVSPIGQQLRELRKRSRSLDDFIKTVSRISSYQEYEELVKGLDGSSY